MEQDILEDAGLSLAALDIKVLWESRFSDVGVDFEATLKRGPSSQRYAVIVTPKPTLATIVAADNSPHSLPRLVIATRINARSAAAFRDARIQYVDAGGNAYLNFGDVYIDIRGQQLKKLDDDQSGSVRAGTNLFSARRAQVICVLLTRPSFAQARLKDVADASGVSIGLAHDAISQLQKAGFIVGSSLRRTEGLLELWAAAYPRGLGPTLALDSFFGDPSPDAVMGTNMRAMPAISGEAAVRTYLGRQRTLTIYVDEMDPALAVVNRWKRDPGKRPNVFVRRRFWSVGDELGQHDAMGELAPWPIVYADLVASGDPRLTEVAREWRTAHGA